LPSGKSPWRRWCSAALAGHWYQLEWASGSKGSCYLVEDKRRRVCLTLSGGGSGEGATVALLRRIARDFLPPRLLELARNHGLKAHGVTIRDQKSRWGSCSETGGISLNWRLILLSPTLQDHVLLHEMAHLNHFDHSRAFHAFLESLDPQATRNARALQAASPRIIHLGRTAS
ncbi:MAG: M48 family metallopeptidase, partial [Oceanipulchritudo sp.]